MKPEPVEAHTVDSMAPAVQWVCERGGIIACARDVLKMAVSTNPRDAYAALKKAGAPVGVYGLLSGALFHEGRKKEVTREREGGSDEVV